MKYRKRPVEVEAYRWTGEAGVESWPDWLRLAAREGRMFASAAPTNRFCEIRTLGGVGRANVGDWILCDAEGEIYPCRADVFERTYEPVD